MSKARELLDILEQFGNFSIPGVKDKVTTPYKTAQEFTWDQKFPIDKVEYKESLDDVFEAFNDYIEGFTKGDSLYKITANKGKAKDCLRKRGKRVDVENEFLEAYLFLNDLVIVKSNSIFSHDYSCLVKLCLSEDRDQKLPPFTKEIK